MAITTDAAIDFFGTQDTLGTSSADVTDTSFSVAGDLSTWTNDDDVREAFVVLLVNYSVAPDANSVINLYLRPLNIQSTNDADIPDANNLQGYVGSFTVNDVTTAQYPWVEIHLPNSYTSQQYEFYLQNATGQTMPAGWDVFVTPKTIGPHA